MEVDPAVEEGLSLEEELLLVLTPEDEVLRLESSLPLLA